MTISNKLLACRFIISQLSPDNRTTLIKLIMTKIYVSWKLNFKKLVVKKAAGTVFSTDKWKDKNLSIIVILHKQDRQKDIRVNGKRSVQNVTGLLMCNKLTVKLKFLFERNSWSSEKISVSVWPLWWRVLEPWYRSWDVNFGMANIFYKDKAGLNK